MIRRRLPAAAAAAATIAVLAGCSSPPPWQPPEPPAADSSVTRMLPTGSYTVTATARTVSDDHTFAELTGYVDFGTLADGADCSAEYEVTAYPTGGDPYRVVSVRAAGGPTWFQELDADGRSAGPWRDQADPEGGDGVFLFTPALVASALGLGYLTDQAGTGQLCSIKTIDRFMKVRGDRLVYDDTRLTQAVDAANLNWLNDFVDAAVTGQTTGVLAESGVSADLLNQPVDVIKRETAPLFTGLGVGEVVDGMSLSIRPGRDGSVIIVQHDADNELVVTLTFTPVETRPVTAPAADTFFSRLAAGEPSDFAE